MKLRERCRVWLLPWGVMVALQPARGLSAGRGVAHDHRHCGTTQQDVSHLTESCSSRFSSSMRLRFAFWGILFLYAGPMVAQPAPAPSSSPPDVVRMRDGGLLRGTIIELLPKEYVEIALPNGRTKVIRMSDVAYAGPFVSETTHPAVGPGPTIDVAIKRIELSSHQEGLTFFRRTGASNGVAGGWAGGLGYGGPIAVYGNSESFERLCTAPCAVNMPAGTYRLGLSIGDGPVLPADPVDLRENLKLDGQYVSNVQTRIAGGVILLGGMLGAIALLAPTDAQCAGVISNESCFNGRDRDRVTIGTALAVGSAILGTALLFVRDRAVVTPSHALSPKAVTSQ